MRKQQCTFRKQFLDSDVKAHNRLRTAIRCKDRPLVQQLIEEGAEVTGIYEGCYREYVPCDSPLEDNPTCHPIFTPLHLAVMSRDEEIVKILLKSGADVNAKVWEGDTPLTLASKMQNTVIVDLLLDCDSVGDKWDYYNLTHLHIACMRNNTKVVKKLLLMDGYRKINEAVDDDSAHWAKYTPLHLAVHFECVETVQLLLKCGADIMKIDEKSNTPLHLAHLHRNEEIIDLILEAHMEELKNPFNYQGLSHFHIACTRDNISVVEHFLKVGEDINDTSGSQWSGWRPIHFALLYECFNVIELLLRYTIDLESGCFSELLENSYITENESVYNLFLKNDINSIQKNEELKVLSTFHNACIENNDREIIKLLRNGTISIPFDLEQPVLNGWTPLHLATKYSSTSVVKVLLAHRANILAQDSRGRTPLHFIFEKLSLNSYSSAFIRVDGNITQYINTFSSNVSDNDGLTILHILCALGCTEIIQKFLQNGVDSNCQVGRESVFYAGFTPLHFAVQFNKPQVVDTLLKFGANILLTNEYHLNPFDFVIHRVRYPILIPEFECYLKMLMKFLLHASTRQIQLNNRGLSILHGLSIFDNTELEQINKYLMAHRHEIDQTIEFLPYLKFTPLQLAAVCSHRFDIAGLLLENGANPQNVSYAGNTFIEGTFILGMPDGKSVEEAQKLFIGALKNFSGPRFHLACGSGLQDLVQSILEVYLELGIEFLSTVNDLGQTPLHSLLLLQNDADRDEFADLLLKKGADVHARDFELQTPLHCAQLKIEPDVTRILITHGADVKSKNIFGQTPLHKLLQNIKKNYTEEYSNPMIFCDQVISLLEAGSDINSKDRRGQTCLMIIPHQQREHYNKINYTLLSHVKKLLLIGYHVSDENKQIYNQALNVEGVLNETDIVEKCAQELLVMQSEYIDPYTTLYNILFKSLNNMTIHCENMTLQNMIQSAEFDRKYPQYGFLIKLQVKNGQTRQPFLNEARKSLIYIFGRLLPNQCVNMILDYFGEEDLKNIANQ
ncbi:hypothetical protein QAD02_009111 [Eretmocerus hayati]|uniref:Uncharacterized protein n=1 Tax=Eretmocerus hayati TaxID=131215 RepID=A0ACC2N8L0_9HYME|nr:hypothetical protein QAD02_009111 [Eretmocerus hayati]